MKNLPVILAALLASACAAVPYQPKPVSRDVALKYVERCMREQPPELGPVDLEITEEYMRAVFGDTDTSWNGRHVTSIDVAKGVYYVSVVSADIDRDEGAYLATLYDKDENELGIGCYSYDRTVVEQFIDGVMALR